MKKYYIQFSTDFHLLASLAAIDDLFETEIVLIGPKTKMAKLLAEKISANYIVADPKSPKINLSKMILSIFRAKLCKQSVIISPFVFPFYTFQFLLNEGRIVKNIIRTDEGVGSYASVGHYYSSLKVENPERSVGWCAIKALVKKISIRLTRVSGLCRESYIFKKDLTVDQGSILRLKRNVDLLGRLHGLTGSIIFVSQPGVSSAFNSPASYCQFVRQMAGSLGLGSVVIKRHPADEFDYLAQGFEVLEGFPLELYDVRNTKIIGFSSTALLMAKILGGCDHVYFMKMKGKDGPFYSGLSTMNKQLFDLYLTSLDGLT